MLKVITVIILEFRIQFLHIEDNSLVPFCPLLVEFSLEFNALGAAGPFTVLVVRHVRRIILGWKATLSAKLLAVHSARLCREQQVQIDSILDSCCSVPQREGSCG